MNISLFLFRLIGIWMLLFAISGCGTERAPKPKQGKSIVTQQVCATDVQVFREFSGRVSAALVAEVRPQVSGIVTKRLFVEGSHVAAGSVLYNIDPKAYQAAYDKAKAELALANADLDAAAKRVARHNNLIKSKAVSQQDFDDSRAEYARIKARISSMEATLSSAKINLERTYMRAPISGFIGRSAITPGALVVAEQPEALATIRDMENIYVDVKMPVAEWLALKGNTEIEEQSQVSVRMIMENGEAFSSPKTDEEIDGEILFTDMEVDPRTGTINMRAIFPNSDKLVPHGMYARLRLGKTVKHSIFVPSRAIRHDTSGNPYVIRLRQTPGNDNYVAENQPISTALTMDNKTLVKSGLDNGDRIVVDGFVVAGQTVPAENIGDTKADCSNLEEK